MRSTSACRQRGRCWWWSISPPLSGALAVAQDMGITVGYLPGLSMRRIADLALGSAKTDARDAAVITGAARSMPHTLRAINASDEEAAALSMLTGFDLDLARAVSQTANRIRGQSFTQTPPSPGGCGGALAGRTTPSWRTVAAWPTPAELKRAGKARTDAGLKKYGGRRHATWAGQIVSALKLQSVTVAGTDAAAVVLPHLARRLIAPRAQRTDVATQVETPWRVAHPHVPGPDHTCPGSGDPAAAVLAGPDPGQGPPGTGAQLASYAGLTPVTRRSGSSIRGEHVSHAATRDSSAPCSPPPSPPCAPPRLPGLLPTQTRPRQNALGQAVLTQAHRRLTHHTGAPPFRTGRHSTHRLHDTHSSSDHPLDRRPRRPLSSGGQSEPEAHAPHFEGSALEECPGHLSSRPFPRAPGATHRQGD